MLCIVLNLIVLFICLAALTVYTYVRICSSPISLGNPNAPACLNIDLEEVRRNYVRISVQVKSDLTGEKQNVFKWLVADRKYPSHSTTKISVPGHIRWIKSDGIHWIAVWIIWYRIILIKSTIPFKWPTLQTRNGNNRSFKNKRQETRANWSVSHVNQEWWSLNMIPFELKRDLSILLKILFIWTQYNFPE